jgi:hypothetical protein
MSLVMPPQMRIGCYMGSMCQATSVIQGRHHPTNQTMTHGLHKDKRVHSGGKPTQNVIHTWSTPKSPHVSHSWMKKWTSQAHRGLAEPTLGQLILAFHMVASHWSKASFSRGAFAASQWTSQPINRRFPSHFLNTPLCFSSLTFGYKARE